MRYLTCLLIAALPMLAAADNWLPVRDVSLMVEPGSILDLSGLLPPNKTITSYLIVNKTGQFALSESPNKSQRFLMATLPIDLSTGSFPNHTNADLYANQMRLHGYNMARLHYADAVLMHQRRSDFDFNPEQMDRFHYLLAALKREGIYYVIDGLSSGNGGYGSVKEQWVNERNLKQRIFYDSTAQEHWKKLVARLLGSINPYTGLQTLVDPALAGIIMVNEGGLAFVMRNGAPEELRVSFTHWLERKYGDIASLRKAWRNELKADENFASNNIALPKPDAWTSQRMSDAQRFYVELERTTADWMTQYLRQAGFKGLLTAYDNWLSPAAHISRGQFAWVDLHNYYFEPTNFVAPGSVMRQESMLGTRGRYIAELAAGRHIGKAFTVSEYGQVFWNRYRRETALAMPTYASFQRWSMIAQHGSAFILSYAEPGGRKNKIYPFMIGTDPITRAGETLAALLFLRGDVAPSKYMLGVALNPATVYDQNAFLGNMPRDIDTLAFVTGIGVDWDDQSEDKTNYTAQIAPNNSAIKILDPKPKTFEPEAISLIGQVNRLAGSVAGPLAPKISKTDIVINDRLKGRIAQLRKANLLRPSNLSNIATGIYQSDTEQIVFDSPRRRLTVITPYTEAATFDTAGPIALDNLTILEADAPSLLSVSAMDGQPLKSSQRMLIVLATDARNTGMRFSDSAETTLINLGTGPAQIRTTSIRLKLKTPFQNQLKVFSANLRGQRGDAIQVTRERDGISFVLDTAKLSHGPTTYFEITNQD